MAGINEILVNNPVGEQQSKMQNDLKRTYTNDTYTNDSISFLKYVTDD